MWLAANAANAKAAPGRRERPAPAAAGLISRKRRMRAHIMPANNNPGRQRRRNGEALGAIIKPGIECVIYVGGGVKAAQVMPGIGEKQVEPERMACDENAFEVE